MLEGTQVPVILDMFICVGEWRRVEPLMKGRRILGAQLNSLIKRTCLCINRYWQKLAIVR